MFSCSSHVNITDNSHKSGGITRSWITRSWITRSFKSPHVGLQDDRLQDHLKVLTISDSMKKGKKKETTDASRDKDEFIF